MKSQTQIEAKLAMMETLAGKENAIVSLDHLKIELSKRERLGLILGLRWVLETSKAKDSVRCFSSNQSSGDKKP